MKQEKKHYGKRHSKKLCGKKSRKLLESKAIRQIKARINKDKDIRKIIKSEEDYYKPVRVGNFWNNNYIKYESNGDKNKTLSVKEYLDEINPYS